MASAIVEELEWYVAMVKGRLKTTEKELAMAKSKKEAGVMVVMKAYRQMEDPNNHLHQQEVFLQTLITNIKSCFAEQKEDLQW